MISCPVSNREKYLPTYLNHLYNLDFPKDKISLYFLVNNSQDNSYSILNKFFKKHRYEYINIMIDIYNDLTIPKDLEIRATQIREKYIYKHLSNLRNIILSKCDSDYLFSVDSDIFLGRDILKRLLSHNVDIVSCLIYNGYLVDKDNPYKYPNILMKKDNNLYTHLVNYWVKNPQECKVGKLIKVDATGACILMKKEVCQKTKYLQHFQGEDCGFAIIAERQGFQMFCDLSCFAFHAMNEEYLTKYINNQL
jgi:hypothetical protein